MCSITDSMHSINCFSSGIALNSMSKEDLQERAEKDQRKVKLFEEYTKILGALTYQEWNWLKDEMDRLFKKNLRDMEKTVTLHVLRDITQK